jgi:hypothetical protein
VISTDKDLGVALARLERASRHHLAELWAEYFQTAPPPRTSRALMIRAVAYKMPPPINRSAGTFSSTGSGLVPRGSGCFNDNARQRTRGRLLRP